MSTSNIRSESTEVLTFAGARWRTDEAIFTVITLVGSAALFAVFRTCWT